MRRFAIGDVHGCYHTLKKLIEEKIILQPADTVYFLGDLIDRGPLSKKVLDYIQDLIQRGFNCQIIGGNHEEVACKVYRNEIELNKKKFRLFKSKNPHLDLWLKMGGTDFLESFQVSQISDIPVSYIEWMESFKNCIILDDYILVHAGLNFNIPDIYQDEHAMRWIREFEVDLSKTENRVVVHGHVPLSLDFIEDCVNNPDTTFIPLDNGCVYRGRASMGHLVALELNSKSLFIQPCID